MFLSGPYRTSNRNEDTVSQVSRCKKGRQTGKKIFLTFGVPDWISIYEARYVPEMLRRPALTVLAFHTVLKNVKKAITELKLKVERCSLIIMQIRIAPA